MKKSIVALAVLWLTIVGLSGWWNLNDEQQENQRLAFETARAFFRQMVITRAWNARHGGVYVLVTEEVQPNPFLEEPLRDLVTTQGLRLTKINPAFMTRQISEISSRHPEGIQFHITSLKPLRPANGPTDWEKKWLTTFEQGVAEAGGFFHAEGRTFFRYMAPLRVENSCLQCHAKQGYKLGDIRGGISVTLPHFSEESHSTLLAGYGVAGALGMLLIVVGGALLEKKRLQLIQSNQALQQEVVKRQATIDELTGANARIKTLSGIIPICMHCKGIRDDQGYWNKLEKFIAENSEAQFSHSICDSCLEKLYPGKEKTDK